MARVGGQNTREYMALKKYAEKSDEMDAMAEIDALRRENEFLLEQVQQYRKTACMALKSAARLKGENHV